MGTSFYFGADSATTTKTEYCLKLPKMCIKAPSPLYVLTLKTVIGCAAGTVVGLNSYPAVPALILATAQGTENVLM
jgi:hypothetical protein